MIDSCAIIVTQANDLVGAIHARMPVILDPEHYELWLDQATQEPHLLDPLLSGADEPTRSTRV